MSSILAGLSTTTTLFRGLLLRGDLDLEDRFSGSRIGFCMTGAVYVLTLGGELRTGV